MSTEKTDQSKESEEGLKRRAYSTAIKLKNQGLDRDSVYARLEKDGIPEHIIIHVFGNLTKQARNERVKSEKPQREIAWLKIVISILIVIISYLAFPKTIQIPIGLALSGMIYLLATRKRS